jgi:hypothetical protein
MIARQAPVFLPFAALSALVLAVCLCLLQSGAVQQNPAIAAAMTFDLTVTVPALYYLLLVRPKRAPAISLLPVFLACVRVAHLLLPTGHQSFLRPLMFVAAPLEFVAIGLLIQRVRRIAAHRTDGDVIATDPMERLALGAREVYGDNRAVEFLITELSVFYFSLASWWSRATTPEGMTAITCYRKSSWGLLVGVLTFCVLMEGSVAHVMLQRWSIAGAWIWTALDLYAILWLLADFQALRLRPHLLSAEHLHIRFGLRWSGVVPLGQIAAVKPFRASSREPRARDYFKLALLSAPEFVVILREPVEFRGLAGIRRRVTRIGLATDDPGLLARLQEAIAPKPDAS